MKKRLFLLPLLMATCLTACGEETPTNDNSEETPTNDNSDLIKESNNDNVPKEENKTVEESKANVQENNEPKEYVYSGEMMFSNFIALYKGGIRVAYLMFDATERTDSLKTRFDEFMKDYDKINSTSYAYAYIRDGKLTSKRVEVVSNTLLFNGNGIGGDAYKITDNFYRMDEGKYITFSDGIMFYDSISSYGVSTNTFYTKEYLEEKYTKEEKQLFVL